METEKGLPIRKELRLPAYDYSDYGVYFITICCNGSKKYLGKLSPVFSCPEEKIFTPLFENTAIGKFVERTWHEIPNYYPYVIDDAFTLMPDHIHGILIWKDKSFSGVKDQRTLSQVIAAFKSITTREYKKLYNRQDSLWQRNFYETVISDEKQYIETVRYIEENQMMKIYKTINQMQ